MGCFESVLQIDEILEIKICLMYHLFTMNTQKIFKKFQNS